MFNLHFILCNCHVCKWKNAYIEDLNAFRILMIFFNVIIEVKEEGEY